MKKIKVKSQMLSFLRISLRWQIQHMHKESQEKRQPRKLDHVAGGFSCHFQGNPCF